MSAMAAGHHGFQWWNLLHNQYLDHNPHIAAGAVGILALLASGVAYRAMVPALGPKTQNDRDFVPPANLGIRNLFELTGEFVQGIARDVMGHQYVKFLPLFIFVFMWTLFHNLLGLIPGFGSATDNMNTTLAMGAFVFLFYNYQGLKAHGFKYAEHFTGHLGGILLLFLGPMMFVIEVISHLARPMTLGIRLRSNIFGDHTVGGMFADLFSQLTHFLGAHMGAVGTGIGTVMQALAPVPIVMLGMLVCVIQAFIFVLLTIIYVGMAIAHDEH